VIKPDDATVLFGRWIDLEWIDWYWIYGNRSYVDRSYVDWSYVGKISGGQALGNLHKIGDHQVGLQGLAGGIITSPT